MLADARYGYWRVRSQRGRALRPLRCDPKTLASPVTRKGRAARNSRRGPLSEVGPRQTTQGSGGVCSGRSAWGSGRGYVSRGRAAARRHEPLASPSPDHRPLDPWRQYSRRVALEVRHQGRRHPDRLKLRRRAIAAVGGGTHAPLRSVGHSGSRMSPVRATTARSGSDRRSAGPMTRVASIGETPALRGGAGCAVQAMPGAGSRQVPCHQEGDKERQHGCQAENSYHRLSITFWSGSHSSGPVNDRQKRFCLRDYTGMTCSCHPPGSRNWHGAGVASLPSKSKSRSGSSSYYYSYSYSYSRLPSPSSRALRIPCRNTLHQGQGGEPTLRPPALCTSSSRR